MVHLGQIGDPAAFQTLDEPQLPQRSGPVERVGHQPPDQILEFAPAARRRNRDAADVVVDVQGGVLDQPRPVQPVPGAGHPMAQ